MSDSLLDTYQNHRHFLSKPMIFTRNEGQQVTDYSTIELTPSVAIPCRTLSSSFQTRDVMMQTIHLTASLNGKVRGAATFKITADGQIIPTHMNSQWLKNEGFVLPRLLDNSQAYRNKSNMTSKPDYLPMLLNTSKNNPRSLVRLALFIMTGSVPAQSVLRQWMLQKVEGISRHSFLRRDSAVVPEGQSMRFDTQDEAGVSSTGCCGCLPWPFS